MDVMPSLKIDDKELDVVESFKLLGTIVTSDLKWKAITKYMINRGYKKLWVLRRLKKLGANHDELKLIYQQHVICVVEFLCGPEQSQKNKA